MGPTANHPSSTVLQDHAAQEEFSTTRAMMPTIPTSEATVLQGVLRDSVAMASTQRCEDRIGTVVLGSRHRRHHSHTTTRGLAAQKAVPIIAAK